MPSRPRGSTYAAIRRVLTVRRMQIRMPCTLGQTYFCRSSSALVLVGTSFLGAATAKEHRADREKLTRRCWLATVRSACVVREKFLAAGDPHVSDCCTVRRVASWPRMSAETTVCVSRLGILATHHVTGVPLDQRDDVAVGRTAQQVAFPVSWHSSIIDRGRPFADRHHVRDLAARVRLGGGMP